MFDFSVKWGDKKDFNLANGIILTHELSEKLFGPTNSLGRTVSIRFNIGTEEKLENFIVQGVYEKYPDEASFSFSALISFAKLPLLGTDQAIDWKQSTDITFIETDSENAVDLLTRKNKTYVDLYNASNPEDLISAYHYQPLKTMNTHSYKVKNQRFNTMEPVGLIMLLVIAVSLLLLVYFNYINIMIASASSRLKEISVRKVMGSSRRQIIFQFVIENFMICTIAIGLGLFLAELFFLPWFSSIATFELGEGLFSHFRTWIASFALIIISSLSGAIYPSYFISSLNTLTIMKGDSQLGSKNYFRKALLGFQFFLTFLSISIAIAFFQESKNIKERPWGYDPSNSLVVTMDNSAKFATIKKALEENKMVASVTGAVQPLGNYTTEISLKIADQAETVKGINILPEFIDQLGIEINKGRGFKKEFSTDYSEAILVNKAFLKRMNWSSAIGKTLTLNDHRYSVIGEVNDFHYEDFEYDVAPLILMACKPEEVKYLYLKMSANSKSSTEEIKDIWEKINPNTPFEYHYQDEVFNGYFAGFSQITEVLSITSLMMTIISISGVFGLGLLILGKKMKEVSIRKILGADILSIIYLVYKQFLFALLIAMAIGIPISLFTTNSIFTQLSFDSMFSIVPIMLSVIALFVTTTLSVSWHIFKAHTANITTYLKRE